MVAGWHKSCKTSLINNYCFVFTGLGHNLNTLDLHGCTHSVLRCIRGDLNTYNGMFVQDCIPWLGSQRLVVSLFCPAAD